jgi:hypothetical protein
MTLQWLRGVPSRYQFSMAEALCVADVMRCEPFGNELYCESEALVEALVKVAAGR